MRWWIAGLGLALLLAVPARGQTIRLALTNRPLVEGLDQLRAQARLDVVYAERLVADQRTTCRYAGDDAGDALRCVLQASGLRANPVRRRQYVLVAPAEATAFGSEPRGTLAGFLVDAETDEALPGAHIVLDGLGVGTTTNEAGYFAIANLPVARYRVRFSFLGFAPLDSALTVGASAVVRLRPVTLRGDGVEVEASQAQRADLAALSSTTQLPTRELERLPSFPSDQDLFRALGWLPGVHRAAELNGGLAVRGGAPDQNLYLLDGVPVYHPWHAFSLISTFQTDTFQSVRFYRGAFPAEHGGRLASVLDVEMKGGGREAGGTVAVSPLSGRFMVEGPLGPRASFMVSGRRSYLDALLGRRHPVEADGRRDTLRTGYYFYDASAKLTVQPGRRHRLSLTYYDGRDDLDVRLPFDGSLNLASWLRPSDLMFEVDQRWGNRVASARYQYLASRRLFLTGTAYYSGYRAREGSLIEPTATATLLSDYRVRLSDVGLKLDADYYRNATHQLRAGVRAVGHRFRSTHAAHLAWSPGVTETVDDLSRLRAWELTAYVQEAWSPTERLEVLPGVRGGFFSGGPYVGLSPRLAVRYALRPERLYVRGALGAQRQFMHRLRDRYSFLYDLVSSRWIPSSERVRPAWARTAEVGLEATVGPHLRLVAEGYARAARDVLVPEDAFRTKDGLEGPGIAVGALLGQYVPAYTRAYGVELSAYAERGPWLLWASYGGGRSLSRSDALGERDYRPTAFDVPRAFRAVASRQGTHWSFAASANARSGYPHTVPVARYAIADPLDEAPVDYLYRPSINNGRLPPYLRIDLSGGYRFSIRETAWRASLHLYNATNRRNVAGRRYDPAGSAVTFEDRRGWPLLPLLELEASF